MKKIIVSLFLLLFIPIFGNSQSTTWDIIMHSGQPYPNVWLKKISNDTLFVNVYENTYKLQIDSIGSMKEVKENSSHAFGGFLFGAISGGMIGFVISKNSADESGFFSELGNTTRSFFGTGLGILVGGLFGSAVGSGIDRGEIYNLKKRSHPEKIKLLSKLLAEKKT